MNLHEYQAKLLLGQYGLPTPRNFVVASVEEALKAWDNFPNGRCVVKAQVHAGGRGKAGGVKIVSSKDELKTIASKLLGSQLVTYQTTAEGQPVNQLLLEEPCDIDRELYLGAVVDRSLQTVVFMASTEGGVDIEKVADETPEKILTMPLDASVLALSFQGRELAFGLGLKGDAIKQFTNLFLNLARLFVEKDLSLLEINPLVVTKQGNLLCLDGKITLDDNALYRHKDLQILRDESQEDARENRARQWELNYIALDGTIGCMVNGAGLAMATMDLIKLEGGEPANFLDVGGGATEERVTEAFKIILSDTKVKAVLVNIFGGIVRCDLIADGIIKAVQQVGIKVPVVARLEGNSADIAAKKLEASGLNIMPAASLAEAAKKVVGCIQ